MPSVRMLNIALVCVCGFLSACSTPGRSYTDSNLQETLEIEITPNTSKMFVYRLRVPEKQMLSGVRIARGGFEHGDEKRGINLSGSTAAKILENAAYVTEHMGYCREGFLTLDSSTSQFNSWVKGECRESATDEDRKKFGSKQILPVHFKK